MNTRQHLRVVISSPSDVQEERQKAFAIVDSASRQIGDAYVITLKPIGWETHVAPCIGQPQAIIKKQIGDYDIFVGIVWKRFGTPTGKAKSGTEEEYACNIFFTRAEEKSIPSYNVLRKISILNF